MLGALAAGLGLGAVAPAVGNAQVFGPEVTSVEFIGNTTFPRASLERAIATTQTECRSWIIQWAIPVCPWFGWGERRAELRERDVALDVQRLERWYQIRGFREVAVSSEVDVGLEGATATERVRWFASGRPPRREPLPEDPAEIATVRFTIEEGRPIFADSIGYLTPDAIDRDELLDDLPISPGDPWSTLALDATRDTLIRRLRNRGYPDADVLRQTRLPQDQPYRADVTFEVEPGPSARYGAIRIEGIEQLDESTVVRTLPFRSGDPYRLDQIFDAQARLFGLEIVRNAQVERDTLVVRERSVPDTIVPLFVQVSEGDPYRVRGGVGLNNAECFNTEASWTSRNFFGGGRVAQVRGRLANLLAEEFSACTQTGEGEFADLTWLTAIDFSQPWIFSTRNSFNASLFAERQSLPDIFIRQAYGLELSLVRAVGPRTPLTLSFTPELSSLSAAEVLLCTGFLVCSERDIDVLTGVQRIAPVGLNLTRDLANSLLNPSDGYRLVLDFEHAARWTGSEYRYNRAVAEATWYSRVTGSSVVGARVRGGWVGWGQFTGDDDPIDIVHPQRRFYAGGANSVRGFGQSRLGPRVLAVDNPVRLLRSEATGGAGCTPVQLVDLECVAGALDRGFFVSRPIGGTRVLEANLELRLGLGPDFEFVTFGDIGQVWGDDQTIDPAALEFTPGVGVRYLSPVGPIRVDVGYSFRGSESLDVVTEEIEEVAACGPSVGCLTVDDVEILYRRTGGLAVLPPVLFGEDDTFVRRLQLHVSIGQAF